jgi:hypothetical protein
LAQRTLLHQAHHWRSRVPLSEACVDQLEGFLCPVGVGSGESPSAEHPGESG